MVFEPWQLDMLMMSQDVTQVCHAYWFVKNNQKMTSADFMKTVKGIRDILGDQNVEYAILMMAHGFYVFTDKTLAIDPVMTKLATGINFEGEIIDARSKGVIDQVNNTLARPLKFLTSAGKAK